MVDTDGKRCVVCGALESRHKEEHVCRMHRDESGICEVCGLTEFQSDCVRKGASLVFIDPHRDQRVFTKIYETAKKMRRSDDCLFVTPTFPEHSDVIDPVECSSVSEEQAERRADQSPLPHLPLMLFRHVCRLHTDFMVHRYLMSNAEGRWDGAEKAERHRQLCQFYVAAVRGLDDPDRVSSVDNPDYEAVHDTTAEGLTDRLDEVIGFPITGCPDYDDLAPKFFEIFHELAMGALVGSDATGAMDVSSGPLGKNEWRHSNGYVCCGSLRIFRVDIDTNPSEQFARELLDWVVESLNKRSGV